LGAANQEQAAADGFGVVDSDHMQSAIDLAWRALLFQHVLLLLMAILLG
jgi:hypothetical protein